MRWDDNGQIEILVILVPEQLIPIVCLFSPGKWQKVHFWNNPVQVTVMLKSYQKTTGDLEVQFYSNGYTGNLVKISFTTSPS